nr:PREDICTED: uncharacterized protein LOC103553914 [Equus przewalskii]
MALKEFETQARPLLPGVDVREWTRAAPRRVPGANAGAGGRETQETAQGPGPPRPGNGEVPPPRRRGLEEASRPGRRLPRPGGGSPESRSTSSVSMLSHSWGAAVIALEGDCHGGGRGRRSGEEGERGPPGLSIPSSPSRPRSFKVEGRVSFLCWWGEIPLRSTLCEENSGGGGQIMLVITFPTIITSFFFFFQEDEPRAPVRAAPSVRGAGGGQPCNCHFLKGTDCALETLLSARECPLSGHNVVRRYTHLATAGGPTCRGAPPAVPLSPGVLEPGAPACVLRPEVQTGLVPSQRTRAVRAPGAAAAAQGGQWPRHRSWAGSLLLWEPQLPEENFLQGRGGSQDSLCPGATLPEGRTARAPPLSLFPRGARPQQPGCSGRAEGTQLLPSFARPWPPR